MIVVRADNGVAPRNRTPGSRHALPVVRGSPGGGKRPATPGINRPRNIGGGIGTRLLRLAQSESSGSLWLFTFARNLRACRFYEHHGFVAVARGFEPMWKLDDVKYRWVRREPAA